MALIAHRAPMTAGLVPVQARTDRPVSPADWILRQVQGVDAWNAARSLRMSMLDAPGGSRDDRQAASRHANVLRRTHQVIVLRTAAELARPVEPLMLHEPTAVIAHSHSWFAQRITALLEEQGVTVVARTDNGSDALGAIVTEQPDCVLVGEHLEMMTGEALLLEARLFAPHTLRTAQVSDQRQAEGWEAAASAVFLGHHPPCDVADALVELCYGPHADHLAV